MADVFSRPMRSRVMAAVHSRGNKLTEGNLAAILRRNGIRGWRRHLRLIGQPDFAFRRERVAVFVDGCFWHGCAKHLRIPASNRGYWRQKISRNQIRDRLVNRRLRTLGWRVVRIWEHDLSNEGRVVRRLMQALEMERIGIKQ